MSRVVVNRKLVRLCELRRYEAIIGSLASYVVGFAFCMSRSHSRDIAATSVCAHVTKSLVTARD